jgi:RNA polymerase sigma factor (sigma-70 family)
MTADYRVTVKVRNNRILKAIEEVGGQPGAKWCEENGLRYVTVNNLINMTASPVLEDMSLTKTARDLCDVVNKLPEDLWSTEQLYPLEKNFSEIEMSKSQLSALMQDSMETPQLGHELEEEERNSVLESVLASLSEQEQEIIKARFFDDKSLSDIAKEKDVGTHRIRQIEAIAIRKLRHPKRSHVLLEACEDSGNQVMERYREERGIKPKLPTDWKSLQKPKKQKPAIEQVQGCKMRQLLEEEFGRFVEESIKSC